MRRLLLTSVISLLCAIHLEIAYAEEFEIKHADLLEIDKEEIKVKGNILIIFKDAIIHAKEGKIETNAEGNPNKATFSPRTKLILKDRELEADKITIFINNKTILAEGKSISRLKDKENHPIVITCDYQELSWSGENANASGNLNAIYKETKVNSEKAQVIYKNKKPIQVIFTGNSIPAQLEQPTNKTYAREFIFDLNSQNVWARGAVKSTIWPDQKKTKLEQQPIFLNTERLFIDNDSGTITAISQPNKVNISYQETKGQSYEAIFLRNKENGQPEKIIFKGSANVNNEDKQISSEEVVLNFTDKKLTSNTKTNIRPKTLIFKASQQKQ